MILAATEFSVVRISGRDGRVRIDVQDLDTAVMEAEGLGPDEHGRRPMIYAITVGDRQSIHIDERHWAEIHRRRADAGRIHGNEVGHDTTSGGPPDR